MSWKSGLALCALIHRYRPDLMWVSKENASRTRRLTFHRWKGFLFVFLPQFVNLYKPCQVYPIVVWKKGLKLLRFRMTGLLCVYVFAGCKWCLLPGWDLVYHCKWGDSHQLKYPHGSPRAEMSSFPPLFSHTQAYMNALLTLAYNINNAISIHNA